MGVCHRDDDGDGDEGGGDGGDGDGDWDREGAEDCVGTVLVKYETGDYDATCDGDGDGNGACEYIRE